MTYFTSFTSVFPTTTTAGPLLIVLIAITTTLTLFGLKNFPLSYTIRLLPAIYRLFKPRYDHKHKPPHSPPPHPPSSSSTTTTTSKPLSAHLRLFAHHTTTSRAYLPEIDINLHKSNSTFFADADISRAGLLTLLLSDGLANVINTGGGKRDAMFLLAGVQCRFLRPIAPLESYVVSSRVLCWDGDSNGDGRKGGALYVVTYFLKRGMKGRLAGGGAGGRVVDVGGGPQSVLEDEKLRRGMFAVMVTRYVFRSGREAVSPWDVLVAAGLLRVPAVDGEGENMSMDWEGVEKAVEKGMEYVRGCML